MPYKDAAQQKEYQRRWAKGKRKFIPQDMAHIRKRNNAFVQRIKESSPCTDCKLFYPYYVMQFDHVEGAKVNNVAAMACQSYSLAALQAEIDKCELVCANCHAVRTWKRRHGNSC